MNKTKGFIALLGAGFIFGTFGVWIRILSTQLTNFQQIGLRNIIGLFISLFLILITKSSLSFKGVNKFHLLMLGLSLPIAQIFYTMSFLYTKLILGISSFYIGSIIFSLVIGLLIFKEKFTFNKALSLICVLIGFCLLMLSTGKIILGWGLIFGLLAGLFDTISNSFRKDLGKRVNKLSLTIIPQIAGSFTAVFLVIISSQKVLPYISPPLIGIALLFGLLLFSVNYLTIIGFSNFDLNLGSIVIASEILFASILGFLVFKEIPSSFEIIGCGMIVLAIVLGNIQLKLKLFGQ